MNSTFPAPRILVVDDEAAVCSMLSSCLSSQGFAVSLASNGQEAIELYKSHQEIVLVLSDVQMPGMDGPEAIAVLQEINPELRFCFMTGGLGRYTESDLLRLGALGVFRKPFHISEVTHCLQELLCVSAP
jgi:CheY-like chemotaxis protein